MSQEPQTSYALDELSWIDVAAHLARDPRLIVPVGALEQHGPHLPLGSNVLIARRLAVDLSQEFGVLRTPTFHYGVNAKGPRPFAGTASLTRKTLHRSLNELLAGWEAHGVTEFILLTAHRHEPHLETLASLLTDCARVRVVEAWDIEISDLLDHASEPLHGGEAETSLMLHLYPELVRLERARDLPPAGDAALTNDRNAVRGVPAVGAGALGYPTSATAAKGRAIYARVLDAIRRAVFVASGDAASDTL